MQAFLIDLSAPGAQPPFDKWNGCQDRQLEGTCVTVLKCRDRWRYVFGNKCIWAHSLYTTSHHRQHLGGISLFGSVATAIFTFYFSAVVSWLPIACQMHSGVELGSPFLRLRFLTEWDGSEEEKKSNLPIFCYHLTFPESPKASLLSTCKILVIKLLMLSEYFNTAHIHKTFRTVLCKCFVYKKNSNNPLQIKKKNPQPIMHGNIIEVPSGNAMEKACIGFIMAYKFYHIVLFYYQILT